MLSLIEDRGVRLTLGRLDPDFLVTGVLQFSGAAWNEASGKTGAVGSNSSHRSSNWRDSNLFRLLFNFVSKCSTNRSSRRLRSVDIVLWKVVFRRKVVGQCRTTITSSRLCVTTKKRRKFDVKDLTTFRVGREARQDDQEQKKKIIDFKNLDVCGSENQPALLVCPRCCLARAQGRPNPWTSL